MDGFNGIVDFIEISRTKDDRRQIDRWLKLAGSKGRLE